MQNIMNSKLQNITILGATGSIGTSTLNVLRLHLDKYKIYAVSGKSQITKLFDICKEFNPIFAVVLDITSQEKLQNLITNYNVENNNSNEKITTKILFGNDALCQIAMDKNVDVVMAALVGAAGLQPTLAAAEVGKKILLANKEVLVMAGELFMQTVRKHKAILLPVDSEHNAIFQSLPKGFKCGFDDLENIDNNKIENGIKQILLTASGGPFLHKDIQDLQNVSVEQACDHPNWKMGKKVSIDSATMMNKCLEIIEAFWLFGINDLLKNDDSYEQILAKITNYIKVIIHPQSVVHSGVQYVDGSVIMQLSQPNMQVPISYCLSYPNRFASDIDFLDFFKYNNLQFIQPNTQKFPCIKLAYEALAIRNFAGNILNAANEISINYFINKQIKFTEIYTINSQVLNYYKQNVNILNQQFTNNTSDDNLQNLESILNADKWARSKAEEFIQILN